MVKFIFCLMLGMILNDFSTAQSFKKELLEIEQQHKTCILANTDSIACYRNYLWQIDSILPVILDAAKDNIPINEKSSLIQEQISWIKKKNEFFKIQDETFKSNLADGTWKKDMIRITYQQKAEFLLKRIKYLMKKIK